MIRQFTLIPALFGIFAMIISACSDEIGNLAGSEESSSRNSSPESSVSSSNSQTASMTGLSIGSNASQNANSVFASNDQSNLGGNGSLSGRIKSVPYFYTYEGWGSEGGFTGIFILDDGSLVERNNWANDYFTPVDLKNIKYIPDPKTSSEYDYSQCALTEAGDFGDVYCWGTNEYGEVGNGNFDNTLKEEKKTCLTEDCLWFRTDYVYNPFKVLSGVQSLIAHDYNTYCALQGDGIYCWGENTGFTDSSINMVNTPTLVDTDKVGTDQFRFMDDTGVFFVGSQNSTEVSIGWNEASSCKIHESGKVTCQGDNSDEGMLFGKDNKVVAYSANPIEINGVEQAEFFATDGTSTYGDYHVCVLRTDDKIQCWGDDLNEGVVTYTP